MGHPWVGVFSRTVQNQCERASGHPLLSTLGTLSPLPSVEEPVSRPYFACLAPRVAVKDVIFHLLSAPLDEPKAPIQVIGKYALGVAQFGSNIIVALADMPIQQRILSGQGLVSMSQPMTLLMWHIQQAAQSKVRSPSAGAK